jgi:hypothetical protein
VRGEQPCRRGRQHGQAPGAHGARTRGVTHAGIIREAVYRTRGQRRATGRMLVFFVA